jgi:hypothetical protein
VDSHPEGEESGPQSLNLSISARSPSFVAQLFHHIDCEFYPPPQPPPSTINKKQDLELTPSYNLGSESLSVKACYTLDAENKLEATYDVGSNDASLQWRNNSGLGGDGELRVTARANMSDAVKQVPSLLVEKTFGVDI